MVRKNMTVKNYTKERYTKKYKNFNKHWNDYEALESFRINENVQQVGDVTDEVHYIMRLCTQYHLTEAFRAMRINLDDPNVEEEYDVGNIGTPGRIAKMWTGSGTHDDRELLSGRWANKPRLAKFPNTHDTHIPITKRVDLTAVCSHHAAPFSTTFRDDAYAIISYIPENYVLGISKLQRLTDWISQRGWLQEELTQEIYKEISQVAETESVYVKLYNVVHTCESLRGAKSKDGAFTSEYYGGDFNNLDIRSQI
jgi:GTP cyclohydrolase I